MKLVLILVANQHSDISRGASAHMSCQHSYYMSCGLHI